MNSSNESILYQTLKSQDITLNFNQCNECPLGKWRQYNLVVLGFGDIIIQEYGLQNLEEWVNQTPLCCPFKHHVSLVSFGKCWLLCRHAQLCPTLCDSMDCSPPGSAVYGIFQARILEWVAISFSRRSSRPRDRTHLFCVFCIGRQLLYQLRYQWNP